MPSLRVSSLFLASFIALAAVGCGPKPMVARMYDGPTLDKKQVSVFKLGPEVRIKSVDGKPVPGIPEDFIDDEGQPTGAKDVERHIEVAPGVHRLVAGRSPQWQTSPQPMVVFYLHTFDPGTPDNQEMEIETAAGKSYVVHVDEGKRWSVNITSMGVGRNLGRLVGSTPEPNDPKWEKMKGTRWGP